MSPSVHTYVDDREVMAAFDRMAKAGSDMQPIFRAVRQDMKADVAEHFKARRGPDSAWPAPDPDYVRRRTQARGIRHKRGASSGQLNKRGVRRLASLGGLGRLGSLGAYVFEMTRSAITMTLRETLAWATVHQTGGRVGRGARVPARPYLWVSDALERKFVERVTARLIEAWG